MADRPTCDFVHCRNYSEGYCLRSKKAVALCDYTVFKEAYNVPMNRKDKLMEDLLDLVKQCQLNTQQYAKLIRRELQKRNNNVLENHLKQIEYTGNIPRRLVNDLRDSVQKKEKAH